MNMELININDNIKKLFYKLVNQTPEVIKDKTFIYNLNSNLIKLWWTVTTEDNNKSSSCPSYYNSELFNREKTNNSWRLFNWNIDNSKELDGYTFYINTPICQFKVPKLTRIELLNVQCALEGKFEKFIPDYLDKLLVSDFGEISRKGNYSDWEVK